MMGRIVMTGMAALALAMIPRMGAADGDEILAPPSVGVSAGSGYVMAGVGLVGGRGVFAPGDIEIDVPGAVEQVLLYWQGRNRDVATPFETTLIVNGVAITGSQIGISTFDQNGDDVVVYRADITDLGLVSEGANVLSITGTLYADFFTSGAGALVIFDDGTGTAAIDVRDGLDSAFGPARPDDEEVTVPQTVAFAPADFDRTAEVTLFVSEVDTRNPDRTRTSTVLISLSDGSVLEFPNELMSVDGALWDTFRKTVDIPSGVDALTVEIVSEGDDPASLVWLTNAVSIDAPGGECDLHIDKTAHPRFIKLPRRHHDHGHARHRWSKALLAWLYKHYFGYGHDWSHGGGSEACPVEEVTYSYEVTNRGGDLEDLTITDSKLGLIADIPFLASGESVVAETTACITRTTINKGRVEGFLAGSGDRCEAKDWALVLVKPAHHHKKHHDRRRHWKRH